MGSPGQAARGTDHDVDAFGRRTATITWEGAIEGATADGSTGRLRTSDNAVMIPSNRPARALQSSTPSDALRPADDSASRAGPEPVRQEAPVPVEKKPVEAAMQARMRAAHLVQGNTVATALAAKLDLAQARPRVDETAEQALVAKNTEAKLVDLGGDASRGTTITIHGINGSPETVAALSDAALRRGERTLALAYDDGYRRLQDGANDFGALIEGTLEEMPPGTTLKIHGHCMGARTALVALDRLQRQGKLEGKNIELDLVAPPLNGFALANAAMLALPYTGQLIKNTQPGKDMGSWSAFQGEVDRAVLPDNVKMRIVIGDQDELVDATDPRFLAHVERLGAKLEIVPGATHMTVLDRVGDETPR